MKKNLLSILCGVFLLFAGISKAQTYSFAFSQFTNPYTPLVGATDIYGSTPWNNMSITNIPIGFTFHFMGFSETTVDMLPGVFAWPPAYDTMGVYAFFASLNDTGRTVSKSPVCYLVTGTAGNHILKVQCQDAGFSNEFNLDGAFHSVVNFQTWFYESDHAIEVHMGPSTITNPAHCYNDSLNPGPTIGPLALNSNQSALLYSLLLSGSASAPTASTWTTFPTNAQNITGTPADGTVYRFAEVISGINEAQQVFTSVGLMPNPANENCELVYNLKNANDVNVMITDMQGRKVSEESLGMMTTGTHQYSINTNELSNGIYFVTLISGEQKIVQKLNVAH